MSKVIIPPAPKAEDPANEPEPAKTQEEQRLAALETAVADLTARLEKAETTIADLAEKLQAAETNGTALAARIDAIAKAMLPGGKVVSDVAGDTGAAAAKAAPDAFAQFAALTDAAERQKFVAANADAILAAAFAARK